MRDDASSERVRTAIDSLYSVFSRYPLSSHIDVCPHCRDTVDLVGLHRVPLRELEGDALATYTFKAMTTVGDVETFKYFLPRILQVAGEGYLYDAGKEDDEPPSFRFPVDWFVMLGKLEYGDWLSWPNDETAAVTAYFESLLAVSVVEDSLGDLNRTRLQSDLSKFWHRSSARQQVRLALQALACDAQTQANMLPSGASSPREPAAGFHNHYRVFKEAVCGQGMLPARASAFERLDTYLEELESPNRIDVFTVEALLQRDEWTTIRSLAHTVLTEMGWPASVPTDKRRASRWLPSWWLPSR